MRAAYQLALLYCDEGRWDDAEDCLSYGKDVPVPTYFLHEAVLGLVARARLTAHRGRLAEAMTLAQRGVELAERSDMLNLGARARLALAEVQERNGEPAEATVAVALGLYEATGNEAAARRLRALGIETAFLSGRIGCLVVSGVVCRSTCYRGILIPIRGTQ